MKEGRGGGKKRNSQSVKTCWPIAFTATFHTNRRLLFKQLMFEMRAKQTRVFHRFFLFTSPRRKED